MKIINIQILWILERYENLICRHLLHMTYNGTIYSAEWWKGLASVPEEFSILLLAIFTSAEYWYWFANELSAPVMLLSLLFSRHRIPLNVFCYVTFVLVPPALTVAEHKDCLCLKVSSRYPLLGLRCEKRKDKELLWHRTEGNVSGKQNLVVFGALNVTPWKKLLASYAKPDKHYQA